MKCYQCNEELGDISEKEFNNHLFNKCKGVQELNEKEHGCKLSVFSEDAKREIIEQIKGGI